MLPSYGDSDLLLIFTLHVVMMVCRRFMRAREAAVTVQRVWRGYHAVTKFQRFREACITLQAHHRGYIARKSFQGLVQRRAAVKIQVWPVMSDAHRQNHTMLCRVAGIVQDIRCKEDVLGCTQGMHPAAKRGSHAQSLSVVPRCHRGSS